MSMIQCRRSITLAAVVVALLTSRPADAQVFVGRGPTGQPAGLWDALVSGAQYDIVNQTKAERRLQYLQAKVRRNTERGDSAAVGRDARRIDDLNYRIAVDEWLIRKNLFPCAPLSPYPARAVCPTCSATKHAAR